MKKTTFKFTVFGLFLAVFLCFAFLSNNFIGVYANESTDEILEEETVEDEVVEDEVIEEEIVEEEITEDEVVEDTETEPSEDLGFLEQYWKTIVASLLGTFGGVGGLLLFVLKFLKTSKNILTDVGEQNTDNKTVKNKIEKVVEKLTLAEENLNKIIQKTEEYEKKLETNANSLFENYGEELKTLEKDFLKFADVMKIVVNNNSELVKKGIAEKVNKIIDEKE